MRYSLPKTNTNYKRNLLKWHDRCALDDVDEYVGQAGNIIQAQVLVVWGIAKWGRKLQPAISFIARKPDGEIGQFLGLVEREIAKRLSKSGRAELIVESVRPFKVCDKKMQAVKVNARD